MARRRLELTGLPRALRDDLARLNCSRSAISSTRAGDAVTVIDAASGKTSAKIVKTDAGNAEKLAP
jgi:hypothetical protein